MAIEFLEPEPDTIDEAALAQEAAEAAASRLRRRIPQREAQPEPAPLPEGDDVLPSDLNPDLGGEEVGLRERFRLNQVDSFYRGTLAGTARLQAMSHFVVTPDEPDTPPEVRKARDRMREEYRTIVADLARYDAIPWFGSTMEATVALGGVLTGALPSPESFVGAAARGGTMLARTGFAAAQQGGIQLATDPVIQLGSMKAGVQKEYEWMRTAAAPFVGAVIGGGLHVGGELITFVGAVIGGGLHVGGELITSTALKRARAEIAAEDPSMRTAEDVNLPERAEPTPEPTPEPLPEAAAQSRMAPEDVNQGVAAVSEILEANPTDRAARADLVTLLQEKPDPELAAQASRVLEQTRQPVDYAAAEVVAEQGPFVQFMRQRLGENWRVGEGEVTPQVYQAAVREFISEFPDEAARYAGLPTADVRRPTTEVPTEAVKARVAELEQSAGTPRETTTEDVSALRAVSNEAEARSLEARAVLADDDQALAARQGGAALPMERARPDTGVPTSTTTGTAVATIPEGASPQQATAIRSLQQQSFDLADAIGFPLREGRVKRGALGMYKVKSGVVRVREVPDFEVVAHEAGHAIEAKIGKTLTVLTQQYASELAPLVSNPAAYKPSKHVEEGFAEYVRRFIGNPAHAAQVAPGFTVAFRNFLGANHPEIMKAIDNASAAFRAYNEAPSVDAVAAVRRSRSEEPKGWRKYLPDDLPGRGTIRTILAHAYTWQFDRNAPVARAVREMAAAIKRETGGLVQLKASENPEILLRLFARTEQAAVADMIEGVRPYRSIVPEGPSMAQAIAKATGKPSFGRWDDEAVRTFDNYLIARRAEYLWRKHEAGKLQSPPTAFSRADASVAMTELERANPDFREASDMVHAYTRELLRKAYEGNLIGRDLYDRLLQEEFYVPFMRDLSDKPLAGGDGAVRGTMDRVADVVQRMTGSSRDIKSPLESLMMQTFLVNRTVRHNDIMLAMRDLSRRAGREGGRYFEEVPAHEARAYNFDLGQAIERKAVQKGMTADEARVLSGMMSDVFGEDPIVGTFFRMEPAGKRGEPIVFYKEGGELKAGRIMSGEEGHALYETLTELPRGLQDTFSQLLSASSGVLRAGITSNPVYVLTNYIKDQLAVGILRPDYIPFISGWKGLVSEARQGEAAKLYGVGGGVSAGASIAPLQQAAEANINALAKQGYLVNRLSSLDGLMQLASFTEAGTRNSVFDTVFKAKKKQGLSDYEAMIEAAYSAQDIMDFSRWGSKTLMVRRLTPFFNAHLQGLDKARRALIEPLMREAVFATDTEARRNAILGLTKVFGISSVLGAAWAAAHHADEAYQEIRPELRGTHFVTTIGGKLFVIPKPYELSLGFTAGEFAYLRLMKDDPRAAQQFAKAAHDVLMPPVPIFANPLIKTSAELVSNYSFFTKRDIVSDTLQRREPAQQYTDRTSQLAKWLGKQTGLSPIKIDYAAGGYFGLWGRDMMALSSGISGDAPVAALEDRVFLRRFIKDPTRSSEATTAFWDAMGATTGKYNRANVTYMEMIGRRSPEGDQEAHEFLRKLSPNERSFVVLRSAANEDGKTAFKPDHRRLHPLQRAYDAVEVLNGVRREMSNNNFALFESGEDVRLSPPQRREVIDAVRELAQKEMRNALVIMKEPGYEGRPLLELDDTMARIRAISPQVADEITTRYATKKVYPTESVARVWPDVQRAVLQEGSAADLDTYLDAVTDRYEFGGDRVKRPQRRRVPILNLQ